MERAEDGEGGEEVQGGDVGGGDGEVGVRTSAQELDDGEEVAVLRCQGERGPAVRVLDVDMQRPVDHHVARRRVMRRRRGRRMR